MQGDTGAFSAGAERALEHKTKGAREGRKVFFLFWGGGLDFINLFLEKGEGREKEREGIIDV